MQQGVPFCKQCGAPQIRVIGFEPQPTTDVQPGESSPDILAPPALPTLLPASSQTHAGTVQWSLALPGAALGGVFSLLAMVIPYAMLGPAFLLGGGLAVSAAGGFWLYDSSRAVQQQGATTSWIEPVR